MGTNWHELRDFGSDRARAAIQDAQRRHRADRAVRSAWGGVGLRRGWLALRSLLGHAAATPLREYFRGSHLRPFLKG